MRNGKSIAVMSALLGGMATFSLGTTWLLYRDRDHARDIPARLPDLAAKPISDHRTAEPSSTSQTELVAYTGGPTLLTASSVLLTQVPPAPGSAAAVPKILGVYKEKSVTSSKQITSTDPKTNLSKVFVNIEFPETDDQVPKGVLTLRIGEFGSVREVQVNIADKSKKIQLLEFDVTTLEMKQTEDLVALWDPEGEGDKQQRSRPSDPVKLSIDNVPPRILTVNLVGETGGVGVLEIQFANNDLKKETINSANFLIHRTGGQHDFATAHTSFTILDRTDDSFVVRLNLGSLITDLYQVEIKSAVSDQHDNSLAEPRKFTFNSLPEAARGPHVPFPEYVRRKERNPQDVFNPGDKVETRVARLYYIRDAHRVAQIINRNVKAYNQSGVERTKLDAKNARETAEQATRDRQIKERDAIRAAESNRQLERELAGARQELEQLRAVMSQRDLNANQGKQKEKAVAVAANQRIVTDKTTEMNGLQADLKTLNSQISDQQKISDDLELEIQDLQYTIENPPIGVPDVTQYKNAKKAKDDAKALADAKLTTLRARKEALTKQLTDARSALQVAQTDLAKTEQLSPLTLTANSTEPFLAAVRTAASKVAELERAVADKRQIENDKRENAEQAQELEDRAKENQFRAEVAAGTEDPDTYVPGDVKSEDPVTQVSVSVIGEGLLQLRGPIRGINKIRTMINQIDSPLGQVKVGIFTVQVNGEHGDRMEKVATRIEGHIDLSRFLTNQSLGYLRRAIQEVAGAVVANVDAQFPGQHRQIDRDRKYLYAFFGRDFIDELYEMDSEFLRTENKLLSLHGMDTVSQSQACFIMALSKNDIRQHILDRFRCLVECDLPQAEWDYRKTSSLLPCKLNSQKEVCRNAFEKYKFRNVHGFFEASVYGPETMSPMQREFIRLAQIFKSQMIAETELKQRVIERGMIEDAANDEVAKAKILESVRQSALQRIKGSYQSLVDTKDQGRLIKDELEVLQAKIKKSSDDAIRLTGLLERLDTQLRLPGTKVKSLLNELPLLTKDKPPFDDDNGGPSQNLELLRYAALVTAQESELLHPLTKQQIRTAWQKFERSNDFSKSSVTTTYGKQMTIAESIQEDVDNAAYQLKLIDQLVTRINDPKTPRKDVEATWKSLTDDWDDYHGRFPDCLEKLRALSKSLYAIYSEPERQIALSESIARRVRRDLDHRKLLEFLIDEQEEKYIELVEGTRSHLAQIDNYLKRLAIALEDDFKVQFYDPAFAGVRGAAREWDVNLGQVERTTILTNNRQFAKVSPQATMEFDLPKRAPMIVEGMNGARALVQEYGTLLQDPTFLSLSGMMSGSPVSAITGGAGAPMPGLPNQGLRTASVRTVLPGQSTDAAEQLMSQTGGPDRKFGASLEALIPDPAIYKFETGTGFEIRPVIQPDGHSVIYDFDYMYTTNVREPVRPDEKHLGRVKRHFIHTQVQTSSFELREISRYQVALKASRTSRGVPLLEDIPGAGVLFRPLPSDESSLQQNIILAQSTVYPTLFDLMGLRWSKYVVDLDHLNLRDLEHVTRGREQAIHDFTFDEASNRVDEFLDIQGKHDEHLRPDLYHQQRMTSPNHPKGYQYQPNPPMTDPNNRSFTIPDRRPEEYRNPAYDPLRRNPVSEELRQIPTPGGMPEDIDLRLQPPEDVPASRSPGLIEVIPIPPSPAGGPGAQNKNKPQVSVIQPANFERTSVRPAPRMEITSSASPSSVPEKPESLTATQKKSWLKKLMPTKAK